MRTRSLIFLLTILLLATSIFAQGTRSLSSVGRRLDDWDKQRTKVDRDAMSGEMRGRKPAKEELQNAARIRTETREDLEGLQLSYNKIVTKLTEGQTLDQAFISEAVTKINKHANRLKANVIFPKPEKEEEQKPVEIPGDSRKRLHDLCTRIYEFLTNRMIENPNVLDVEAATRARLSLESVIELSEKLRAG